MTRPGKIGFCKPLSRAKTTAPDAARRRAYEDQSAYIVFTRESTRGADYRAVIVEGD
jgi:hypothetical protein